MSSRARIRVGREVHYYPTAAEVAALGVGPWPGKIVGVSADGSVNIDTAPPAQGTVGAALADPLVTTANAIDLATAQALANANKVAINLMVTRLNQLVSETGETRKTNITLGGNGGQYALVGDPAFV